VWTTSLIVANAVFVLFVVAAGFTVTVRETLQAQYGIKEILPRLVVGAVASNLSLLVCQKAIEAGNALTAGIAGQGVDPASAAEAFTQALTAQLGGTNILMSLLVIAVLVLAIVVVFTFILRIALLVVVIGAAPLALLFHALPQTEALAYTWWRALAACLGAQVAQAIVVLAAVKVFLTPAGPPCSASLPARPACAASWCA
jgi:hypothetical protein